MSTRIVCAAPVTPCEADLLTWSARFHRSMFSGATTFNGDLSSWNVNPAAASSASDSLFGAKPVAASSTSDSAPTSSGAPTASGAPTECDEL